MKREKSKKEKEPKRPESNQGSARGG